MRRADESMANYEKVHDYFEGTPASEREHEYFETGNLKAENRELKRENQSLKELLQKAYDFMRQFTMNGLTMLEHFLKNIGEKTKELVLGLSR